ncbi:MAG: hypothetical protein ACE1ZQ_09365 [Ignavibacteriaceae bacterium]
MKNTFTEDQVREMVSKAWINGFNNGSKGKERIDRSHLSELYADLEIKRAVHNQKYPEDKYESHAN